MNLSYFFLGFLEFGNQSKLFLITKKCTVTAPDQIMHTLTGNALFVCNLTEG